MQNNSVVRLQNVSRRFGRMQALSDVSLEVPEGVVFGLVGRNGAGKTTLIRHVMGLLRAAQGSVSVFGLDPVSYPTQVLAQIGYLSEGNELPEWMSVRELMHFTRAYYPTWDDAYADSLRQTFEIDPDQTIQKLSKGQRARVGLTLAIAHRPKLLVLDEPSSGLDPLVRRDILRAIIKTIAEEGRTVIFSSHLLDEVERVADHVAILEGGRLIRNDELESLKSGVHRVVLRFAHPHAAPPSVQGFFNWQGNERNWSAYFSGARDEAADASRRLDAELVERASPSLNEIFLALVGERAAQPEQRA
jgi:ABC-type multidrug transport system ATPase subunit